MPTFVSDPTTTTYLLFAVLVAVAGVAWVRLRSRKATIALAVAVGLLGLLFLIDKLVESPREEAVRRVNAMCDAATAVQPDRFIEHLSTSFTLQGADREKVRRSGVWGLVSRERVRAAAWGFGHDETEYKSDTEVEIRFFAKAQTPNREGLARYVRATFVREDGAFKLKMMQFYHPINTREPEPIPGFP